MFGRVAQLLEAANHVLQVRSSCRNLRGNLLCDSRFDLRLAALGLNIQPPQSETRVPGTLVPLEGELLLSR